MSWVTKKIDTVQPTKGNPASLVPPVHRPSAIGLQNFANYLTRVRDPIMPDSPIPDAIVYTDQYPPAETIAAPDPLPADHAATAIDSPEPILGTTTPASASQPATPTTPPLSPEGTSLTEPDNLLSGSATPDNHATNADSSLLSTKHSGLSTVSFGARLRSARQAAGITTLRQFSESLAAIGIHRSAASLGNWERDRNRPPNRAQLLPILSLLAQHNSLHTLAEINNLCWLLDWRDLNTAEIERYFPTLTVAASAESQVATASIDANPTQPPANPDTTIIAITNHPVPAHISRHAHILTSYRDHLRDHPTFFIRTATPNMASYPMPNQPPVELQSSTGSG